MKIVLFGATGMVGQGMLRECLLDPRVTSVITVGRRPTGQTHAKLTEIVHRDLHDLSSIASHFRDVDACFFSLGISSVGISEADYARVMYDLPLAVARTLWEANPAMVFILVTGQGTDSTEKGSAMWARVKGRAENAIIKLGFRGAYMFRPGLIIPGAGIKSSTGWYNFVYTFFRPFAPLLRTWRSRVTTTEQVGRAAIAVATNGYATPILDVRDINSL
jgi:uncharacterized protein YbjT (DUF2867 family)